MLIDFLFELRRHKIPVSTHEWMALMEALALGLHESSLDGFYRLCRTTGDRRKAIMAVAASLLTVVYHMIREGTPYRDLGADYFDQGDREAAARRLVSRLRKLGYNVQVSEVAA